MRRERQAHTRWRTITIRRVIDSAHMAIQGHLRHFPLARHHRPGRRASARHRQLEPRAPPHRRIGAPAARTTRCGRGAAARCAACAAARPSVSRSPAICTVMRSSKTFARRRRSRSPVLGDEAWAARAGPAGRWPTPGTNRPAPVWLNFRMPDKQGVDQIPEPELLVSRSPEIVKRFPSGDKVWIPKKVACSLVFAHRTESLDMKT